MLMMKWDIGYFWYFTSILYTCLYHMQNWYYCIILEAEEIDSHIYIVHFHI